MKLVLSLALTAVAAASVPPVVFIPGFSSSGIQYQLHDAQTFVWCNHTTPEGEWEQLWPEPRNQNITKAQSLCQAEILQVHFDKGAGEYVNRGGVKTRTYDFGGFTGIPGLFDLPASYEPHGWVTGKTFFGAPFDFRYSSSGLTGYYEELKGLIEGAYLANGNTKVVLFAISLGPQVALGFLNRMEQDWKDKYIDWFLAESPLWGGSFWPLNAFVSGYGLFGPPGSSGSSLIEADIARTFAVVPWLFPRAGKNETTDFLADEPLVITPAKNYTAYDYDALCKDLGLIQSVRDGVKYAVQDVDLAGLPAPGVDTFITFGYNLPTTGPATFNKSFSGINVKLPPSPTITMISGDGIVPLRSSLRGFHWTDEQAALGKKLYIKGFENQPHADCMYRPGTKNHYGPPVPDDGCFVDAIGLLANGTIPCDLLTWDDAKVLIANQMVFPGSFQAREQPELRSHQPRGTSGSTPASSK